MSEQDTNATVATKVLYYSKSTRKYKKKERK